MDNNKLIELRSIVSSRIDELLKNQEFEFSIEYLKYIHNYLFKNILNNNGVFRTYNITRSEEILNEETVLYADFNTIKTYLDYDFLESTHNNYYQLSVDETIKNISTLTANIWGVHPFDNGNTRSITVFVSKFLLNYGYNVDNHIFKENSKYFRNSLVVANYYNCDLGIHTNKEPLKLFFNKLLVDEAILLDNDSLYIKELFTNTKQKKKILTK